MHGANRGKSPSLNRQRLTYGWNYGRLTAEGHTTVTKPERTEVVDGEIVWENRKEKKPSRRPADQSIDFKAAWRLPYITINSDEQVKREHLVLGRFPAYHV